MWDWLKNFLNGHQEPLVVRLEDVTEKIELDADGIEAEFYRLTSRSDYKYRVSGITRERHLRRQLEELRNLAKRIKDHDVSDLGLEKAVETRNAILEDKRPIVLERKDHND